MFHLYALVFPALANGEAPRRGVFSPARPFKCLARKYQKIKKHWWVTNPGGVGGGGAPYDGLYGEAPPERGTFFRLQVYEKVGISLVKYMKG